MPGSDSSQPYLSVVVPIYDEADSVAALYEELDSALREISGGVEMIWVDDGSRDKSLERLGELRRRDPRVRVVALSRNCGQSAALLVGFEAARGEVVATLDGDLQNDPADIPRMLPHLDRADVVNGVRANRRDTALRLWSSKIANAVRNWATGESVSDVGCSLRLMRRRFLLRLPSFRGMHRFLPTLLRLEGARVVEVPVSHRPRLHGVSKYGLANRLFVGIADLFGIRWLRWRYVRFESRELD